MLPHGQPPPQPADLHKFAKFRLVDFPTPVLLEVANDLATHAAAVTAENGIEASLEVSMCLHAVQLLATRAAGMAARKAERDLSGGGDAEAAADEAFSTVSAASASLIALCEAAREEAKANARSAAAEEEKRRLFPSLGEAFSRSPQAPPPLAAEAPEDKASEPPPASDDDDNKQKEMALPFQEAPSDALLGTSPSGVQQPPASSLLPGFSA